VAGPAVWRSPPVVPRGTSARRGTTPPLACPPARAAPAPQASGACP
jgi:hypothetical protein